MKPILSCVLGIAALASQALAAPPEDRGQGRSRAKAADRSEAVRSMDRPTNLDLLRAPSVEATSQTAIRTSPTTRSNFRQSADAQISTRRFSEPSTGSRDLYLTADRDWDRRDSDRNWSDRRRYHRPPTTVYRSWDRNRTYTWNNNRYRWYGGSWVLYGGPTVVYRETLPVVGASLVSEVQAELRQEGYYRGSVDGLLGPRTRDAIAQFQDDHGLAVSGRITTSLLRELGIR